jgi:AraC-like DNA-binding protein
MLHEASSREFERDPIGRYAYTGSSVVWCATPSLAGWQIWGRPDENETRTILRLLAQYPKLEGSFDLLADTRGVEVVNPPAMAVLLRWLLEHRAELKRRVRVQANVIRRDTIGFLLMGIIASFGDVYPLRVYGEPSEAFRSLAGDAGETLCEEVAKIVAGVRAVAPELVAVRSLLSANVETSVEDAARTLATSPRSLQRILKEQGTSFHDEQVDARFARAKTQLVSADQKVSSIARSVGWSERTLVSIFRARTGLTPTDWRKRPVAD